MRLKKHTKGKATEKIMRIRSKEEIKEIDLVLLNFAFKIVKQRV